MGKATYVEGSPHSVLVTLLAQLRVHSLGVVEATQGTFECWAATCS